MSTRGLIGFVYRGYTYYVYNHYDSYYGYLGILIIMQLLKMLRDNLFDEWLEKFKSLKIVYEGDEIPEEELFAEFGRKNSPDSGYKYKYGDNVIEYKTDNDTHVSFESVLNHKYLLANFKPIKDEYITSDNRACPPIEYIYSINFDTREFITISQYDACCKYSLDSDNAIETLENLKKKWERKC